MIEVLGLITVFRRSIKVRDIKATENVGWVRARGATRTHENVVVVSQNRLKTPKKELNFKRLYDPLVGTNAAGGRGNGKHDHEQYRRSRETKVATPQGRNPCEI